MIQTENLSSKTLPSLFIKADLLLYQQISDSTMFVHCSNIAIIYVYKIAAFMNCYLFTFCILARWSILSKTKIDLMLTRIQFKYLNHQLSYYFPIRRWRQCPWMAFAAGRCPHPRRRTVSNANGSRFVCISYI